MFKKFFDTSTVDAFADWVGVELAKACPPDQLESASKAGARRRAQFDERIHRQVVQVLFPARLNIYQKAKLGSKLQDVLETVGYPAEFRQQLSYSVIRMLAMTSAKNS